MRNGIFALIVVLALVSVAYAPGVAVSPGELEFHALKGGEQQAQFTIFNSADTAVTYTVESDKLKDWYTFSASEIIVPANGKVQVTATVRPPADTANGVYKSIIFIKPASTNVSGGNGTQLGIFAALGLSSTINVTGEEQFAANVFKLRASDAEVGRDVIFSIGIANAGNVRFAPAVDIVIFKDDEIIDTVQDELDSVIPGERQEAALAWLADDEEIGNYTADVTITALGRLVTSRTLQFEIHRTGELSRNGVLRSLTHGEPQLGELLELDATFENTGSVPTRAKFSGEVYINNVLRDTVASEELLVDVGRDVVLESFYRLDEPGDYRIAGSVNFEGKKTDVEEVAFTVAGTPVSVTGNLFDPAQSPVIVIIIVIVIIVILALAVRKIRKKPAVAPASTGQPAA